MMEAENPRVYCFGETLWDILPDGPQPGGAPLNVAYHLTKLGIPTGLISRIGKDEEGVRLKDLIEDWKINKNLLQLDRQHATGKVIANTTTGDEVVYEIVAPVAWDFIDAGPDIRAKVNDAACLVYGSLACRHECSRKTLFELLELANFKVFDINLRPPFYESSLLEALLGKADLLKMNDTELAIIREMLGIAGKDEQAQVDLIRKEFDIREVLVTRGEKGASYYTRDVSYHAQGKPVAVCDTIGSGDAFLAAFLAYRFLGKSPDTILGRAVAMGSFIAGKKGGCPSYTLSEYLDVVDSFQP